MKTVSLFFRHKHKIYFSIEKIFRVVATEARRQLAGDINVKETELPFTSSVRTIWKNIRFVAAHQTEINHITGDIQYAILGCRQSALNILTVHDCVLLFQFPRLSPRRQLILWIWYRLPVKKADIVTVISENTKKDLIYFTGCSPDKIRVISNFIDPGFQPVPRPFDQLRPVLLFIGTAPNKNLQRVIEAVSGIRIHLLIVGHPSAPEQKTLKACGTSFEIQNGLSDEKMREVYAAADMLLFPSLHEGFGLPVLEAQATGRAVITSSLQPMISVAGNAACFVDPLSVTSIREGIRKVIDDSEYRNFLIAKGLENVRRFRSETIAGEYAAIYKGGKKNKAYS